MWTTNCPPKVSSIIYSKVCARRKYPKQLPRMFFYLHQNYLYCTCTSMTPHPIWPFPYCTYYPIYVPYGVSHHPPIPSLGCLHIPPPIILPSYISPTLFTPDFRPYSLRSMIEQKSNRINFRSNLTKSNRRDDRRYRKDNEY